MEQRTTGQRFAARVINDGKLSHLVVLESLSRDAMRLSYGVGKNKQYFKLVSPSPATMGKWWTPENGEAVLAKLLDHYPTGRTSQAIALSHSGVELQFVP